MKVSDKPEYQRRRKRLHEAIQQSGETLEDVVFEMSIRLDDRQSYSYVEAVLNGRSTSIPMLDKVEEQLDVMGILE